MPKAKDFQGQLKEMPGSSRLQPLQLLPPPVQHQFTSQGGTEHPSAVNKKWLSATSSSKSCTANLQASLIMIQSVEEKPQQFIPWILTFPSISGCSSNCPLLQFHTLPPGPVPICADFRCKTLQAVAAGTATQEADPAPMSDQVLYASYLQKTLTS